MKLKIYLADLTHTGLGTATEAFPLNVGVIASYCLKHFKNDLDIKLFKFPEELQNAIDEVAKDKGYSYVFDVIGLQGGMVYKDDSYDITNIVKTKLNL